MTAERNAGLTDHATLMSCREHVLKALRAEQVNRNLTNLDWVDAERFAVAVAANEWAMAHGRPTITEADVRRIEGPAVGHVDYSQKLALYVAEHVCGVS